MSTVVITSTSRGIGRAVALALDAAGQEVIAGVRDQAAAVGGRLDALVNNAGVVVGGILESLDSKRCAGSSRSTSSARRKGRDFLGRVDAVAPEVVVR